MADLTRFDFHAKKFYFSESVRSMSAEEVGQYLLLLVSAWLGGKDASLPDNPGMLAREARVSRVSDIVLEMFPIVETEHGPRRRNETLYGEWLAALSRSEAASERGSIAGASRSEAKVLAARENGKLGGRPRNSFIAVDNRTETEQNRSETEPQTIPNQTKPNQSNQTSASQETVLSSSSQRADWKNIAIRHFRLFSKKPAVKFKDKYYDACKEYSEEVVLNCFDSWATGAADWVKRENVEQPLYSFFKKLPEEAADAVELREAVQEDDARIETEKKQADEQKKREESALQSSIDKQRAEIVKRLESAPVVSEDTRTAQEFMDEE